VIFHNASAVYAILLKLIPQLKEECKDLKTIHYLTDSPTSQYRNRTIFQFIAQHQDEFGIDARWNYLESGHGKGPCDGLGASVKRSAGDAIKHVKCSIQDANDFFAWATHSVNTGSKVRYFLYTQQDYDEAKKNLSNRPAVRPVPGTFKLHFASSATNMEIFTRNLSCYCPECLVDVATSTCDGYVKHSLLRN